MKDVIKLREMLDKYLPINPPIKIKKMHGSNYVQTFSTTNIVLMCCTYYITTVVRKGIAYVSCDAQSNTVNYFDEYNVHALMGQDVLNEQTFHKIMALILAHEMKITQHVLNTGYVIASNGDGPTRHQNDD